MKEVILKVDKREELGTKEVKNLRKSGFIPAVFYGDKKSHSIKIARSALIKFLHEHKGENVIINLKISGDDKKTIDSTVMIKEIQQDPVSEEIIHLDFNKISLAELVTVKIPIEAKGEPLGVKEDGGILEHVLWELEVECLPQDMPKSVEMDVSSLKIGDAIYVKDVSFPDAVKVKHEPDAIVLSVAPPAREEIPTPEEALEGEETTEPEVIKEKKEGAAEEDKEAKEDKTKAQPAAEDKKEKNK